MRQCFRTDATGPMADRDVMMHRTRHLAEAPRTAGETEERADRAALQRVCDGDPHGLTDLYDRHAPAAFALAQRMTGAEATAEEVVQDGFVAVWRHAAKYDAQRGSVRTWLLGIVRYRALDVLRGDRSRRRVLTPGLCFDDVVHVPAPDLALERRDMEREVRRAIAALPRTQAHPIALAFYGGLTQAEIADELRVPLGTIKSRIRMGLGKLAVGMADERGS
jgi:RNA polymerase sigma-70 factor (ECF subfamily)